MHDSRARGRTLFRPRERAEYRALRLSHSRAPRPMHLPALLGGCPRSDAQSRRFVSRMPPDRSPPRRVLVVEDEDDTAELIVEILSDAAYQVERAGDGRAALERLERDPLPSVILLDLHMPVMDGWEFRERQRASRRCAEVPVIVVSADPSPEVTIEVDYF